MRRAFCGRFGPGGAPRVAEVITQHLERRARWQRWIQRIATVLTSCLSDVSAAHLEALKKTGPSHDSPGNRACQSADGLNRYSRVDAFDSA